MGEGSYSCSPDSPVVCAGRPWGRVVISVAQIALWSVCRQTLGEGSYSCSPDSPVVCADRPWGRVVIPVAQIALWCVQADLGGG